MSSFYKKTKNKTKQNKKTKKKISTWKLLTSCHVPLKVTLRSQTFRLSQNTSRKNRSTSNRPFTLVLYSQRHAFVFSKQFRVATAPFKVAYYSFDGV